MNQDTDSHPMIVRDIRPKILLPLQGAAALEHLLDRFSDQVPYQTQPCVALSACSKNETLPEV